MDHSLPSLWGTADWVSTTQETKQAKLKQKKETCCNRKMHFARLRKIVWHHCERAMVMFMLKKTKQNRVDCFLMAHARQIQRHMSSQEIPFIFCGQQVGAVQCMMDTARQVEKPTAICEFLIIRGRPQLYAN